MLSGVLKSIGSVALAIGILLAMVTVHEFGHYIVGKLLNFKITEFSVGFGPAIFKKRSKKSGELFALRVVPLGGYCAFDGEDEYEEETAENAETEQEETQAQTEQYPEPKGERFNDQAPWKRILVLIAGATMNYLLALVLIIAMFAGIGRPLYSVVVEKPNTDTATVATVAEISAQTNDALGLQTGDVILKINGKNVYVITDYLDALSGEKAGAEIPVLVLTNGETKMRTLVLATDANFANMTDTKTLLKAMNIYGLYSVTEKQGFFPSIGHSFAYSWRRKPVAR